MAATRTHTVDVTDLHYETKGHEDAVVDVSPVAGRQHLRVEARPTEVPA